MNKLKILLSAVFTLLFSAVIAQNVSEGSRNFIKKESANGLSIVVQGQPKNVETVLSKKLENGTGEKAKSYKGLKMIPEARYARISSQAMDMYFRVEKVSRSDDNNSRVTLFLAAGNDNFISSETDPEIIAGAAEILEGLQKEVTIYELELAIEAQKKVIDKAIKDHEKMVSDSVKLENKLAETIQEIENNKIDRKNQLDNIAQEEVRLQDFQHELKVVINGPIEDNMMRESEEGIKPADDQNRGSNKNNEESDGDGGN